MIEYKIPIIKLRDFVDAIDHLQEAGQNQKAKEMLYVLADEINKDRNTGGTY